MTHKIVDLRRQDKMDAPQNREYLGDGVYAIFDGFGIWLHANDHKNPTDRVYLEPSVLSSLNRFANSCRGTATEGGIA